MKPEFKMCIFCGCNLEEIEDARSREHVIPDFIHGSLIIQDVCKKCNSRFGQEVDHLILRDGRVINAINKLDLPELKRKIMQEGKTVGYDTVDGAEREFHMRKGKPWLIPSKIEPDGIELDENDSMNALAKMLLRDNQFDFTSKSVFKLVEEIIRPDYFKLDFGQSLQLPDIGYTLKRGRSGNLTTYPRWEPNAANRLIAKIICEIAFYTIPTELLLMCFDDLNSYVEIAMGTVDDQDWRIAQRPDDEPGEPDYNHMIQVFYLHRMIAIDVDLFGCVNYRGVLIPKGNYTQPVHEGRILEGVGIAMSFKPGQANEKRVAFKYAEGWVEHLAPVL